MEFTFNIAPEETVLKKLIKKLPAQAQKLKNLRLDPLPIEGMELLLIPPRGKKLLAIATQTIGLNQKASSQKVTFSINFDSLNSDIAQTIFDDNLGLQYRLKYNLFFMGKSKRLKIKVNWDKIKKHSKRKNFDISKYVRVRGSEKVKLDAKFYKLLEYEAKRAKKDRLKTKKREFDTSDLDNSKSKSKRKKKERYSSRSKRKSSTLRLERNEIAGGHIEVEGYLSLKKYSKEIKDAHTIMASSQTGRWKMVYLPLPPLSVPPELEIEQVILEVNLRKKHKTIDSQKYIWNQTTNWRDSRGTPVSYGAFELPDKFDDFKNLDFKLTSILKEKKGDVLKSTKLLPANLGDTPISDPFSIAGIAYIDFSQLNFNEPEVKGDKHLRYIDITLKEGKRTFTSQFHPTKDEDDNEFTPPKPLYWLVNSEDVEYPLPISAEITFHYSIYGDYSPQSWALNNKNLRELFGEPYVILSLEDWKGF